MKKPKKKIKQTKEQKEDEKIFLERLADLLWLSYLEQHKKKQEKELPIIEMK